MTWKTYILENQMLKHHLHSFDGGPNDESDDETKAKKRHHQNQSLGAFKLMTKQVCSDI